MGDLLLIATFAGVTMALAALLVLAASALESRRPAEIRAETEPRADERR